jgi:molybdenum cofactor guanylyltransferase
MRSLIVLCGGMSKRMGQDKGSMNLKGKPLVVHVIETLDKVVDEIILVLRDENQASKYERILDDYNLFNTNILICTDTLKDQGPLMGISTGLRQIKANKALIIPCDSPFVSNSFINCMFELSEDKKFDAVVPKWSTGQIEPLHAIYPKDSYKIIEQMIKLDIKDVKTFISKLKVKFIDVEFIDAEGTSFINLNQIEDLSRI